MPFDADAQASQHRSSVVPSENGSYAMQQDENQTVTALREQLLNEKFKTAMLSQQVGWLQNQEKAAQLSLAVSNVELEAFLFA
jgi:hypothetical protein